MTRVADIVLDASVVGHIAQRDDISDAAARAYAVGVLQLVAAAEQARSERSEEDAAPLVAPARHAQIVRAARARLWLDEGFAKTRTAANIPDSDPKLARALASKRFSHPKLHRACQIVVIPDAKSRDEAALITTDPQWRARAQALLGPIAAHIERYVPAGDKEACALLADVFQVLKPKTQEAGGPAPEPDLVVRYEKETMFDLTACASKADDGTCTARALDTDWTDRVATMDPETYSGVFATGWGLHHVYLSAVKPAADIKDPAVRTKVRESVHPAWLAEQLELHIAALQEKRAVRIATRPATDPPVEPGS